MIAILDDKNKIIAITNDAGLFLNNNSIDENGVSGFLTIGYFHDESKNAFIPPQPYPSYILDEENFWWNPPIPYPNDGVDRYWNEENQSWDQAAE